MTEHQEALILATYLRNNKYMFHHSPNETYTKSWNQKRKNKQEWVSKWFPDYTIILKNKNILFIELKKTRWPQGWLNGSVISPEQENWCTELNQVPNVQAEICHWAKESIELIERIELIK